LAESFGFGSHFDSPEILQKITALTDSDLCKWDTYRQVREQLGRVELVFQLDKR
jgi:hypothetical protein